MMIKTMMFQDRICSHMIELTLVVFVSRVACSCPVRVGASLLALLFPSWLIEEGVLHSFSRLLFRVMVQRTRHIDVDVLALLPFVSFSGLKKEAYTCVLSLFRRVFAPFHRFTVLVSTRSFKRDSPSRIKGPGNLGFKERVMLRGYRACFDSWL